MTKLPPRILRGNLACFLTCLVGVLLPASPLYAARPATHPVFSTLQPANDSTLPASAKEGSGANGIFNAVALESAEMSITLPDRRVLIASRQQDTQDPAKSRKSWVGTFSEQPGSIAAFTTLRGVTTGVVSYGAETWEMVPARGGGHVLYRVDDRKLPSVELEAPQVGPGDRDVATVSSDYGVGTTTATGGSVVDLLVVYTPAARAAHGQATLASMIQNAVAMANQAYLNSRVAITLNLVGLQEISYTESGVQSSLDSLRGATDGKMDSVHTLRNSVGADVVTLVSNDSDACGMAGVMTSVSSSFAPMAFNVVKSSCLSQHSLAHEIGHNMGNKHDRASTTGSGAYPYSYGFRRCTTDGTGFRTVMSYSCTGASRVAWFSNPSVYYNGYATGVAYETSPTNSADNARSMSNAAATVAGFRAAAGSIAPSPPATVPTAPGSLSAVAASASAINLRWTDNSTNETGFVVLRSTNGVDFTQVATLGASITSYSSSGLAASTLYYYRVWAYNSVGNSSVSNTVSAKTTVVLSTPAKPTNLAVRNIGKGSVKISWVDASTNESAFEVMRAKWDSVTRTWGVNSTIGRAAQNGTAYTDWPGRGTFRYSVRAVNSAGASAYAGPLSTTVTK